MDLHGPKTAGAKQSRTMCFHVLKFERSYRWDETIDGGSNPEDSRMLRDGVDKKEEQAMCVCVQTYTSGFNATWRLVQLTPVLDDSSSTSKRWTWIGICLWTFFPDKRKNQRRMTPQLDALRLTGLDSSRC